MARLREQLETSLPIDEAFAFVADFANSSRWDPGVAYSEALTEGPVRIGSRYRLGVRMGGRVSEMEYRVTALETPRRVVLAGEGPGVSAVDEIRFASTGSATRIDYTADIHLRGLLRLVAPLAGGAFDRIARNARDGMQRTLDELAGRAPVAGARA